MNKKAFLVFEFVVIIALMIVFSTCILVSFSWFSRFIMHAELKSVVSFFLYMQQKAIVQQEDLSVVLDVQNNSYYEINTIDHIIHILHPDIQFKVRKNVKGPPSSPQDFITKPVTFVDNTIIFYKTGIISSGTLYILDCKNNAQYALSNAISSISSLRLYQYIDDAKWQMV